MATGSGEWAAVKPVRGFRLGVAMAGIRKPGRRDLVVMNWDKGSSVAGVFTLNRFCAAPVYLSRQRLAGDPRYFLINTGNANAGTGEQGVAAARQTSSKLATLAGVDEMQVLPFSTGVIGEQLPVNTLCDAIPAALSDMKEDNWFHAAEGIMTTDTRPKGSSRQFAHEGTTYTISGISKGAGMIKPNMATMLAYIATDAAIEPSFLQNLLLDITHQSFNRITIDGDTSTNDSFMVVATGAAGNDAITSRDSALAEQLIDNLRAVSVELAQAIVRDGEGATRFVTVQVEEAASQQDALEVAYTVAHSPLVKTALFACDPNWGRILAAVGRADIPELIIDRVSIWLDTIAIVDRGQPAAGYTEQAGQQVMNQEEILIKISLGAGSAAEEIWTTDLSHEYVKINAEYRT
ncbi:bifunctional glutamate N-acetyltransferase/amino-acid acetyltransferase ArgJ [Endozoicomonas sp. SCSIO W0465]|uniref:bifunctional glutamate N-acetyltransferase/amino-acid acetyltransferase ArgJ n=1 Tax=Endozoicomonas sp. SCSIO W0465 TaxID=2918516 RepID=UPI002074EBA0|nr:bifunctional glutamate N-acetyltransferase/amino-acid acetyltransferase ArgJ [Endozoicomonas sp. SCSIO W0465]USE34866.1 bifunctional glutamate N-acetyltransferase/amino-acid acetyltransferase ArgJ [Endozoicomonas sp. SCSIO W0465]